MEGVTVRLAGPFSVHRGGVAPGGIGAGKAHRLLVLLAVERHRLVPTDRIIDGLWGGLPPRRPAENVATLVSRLRVALGPGAVEGGRHGYRLGRDPAVRVDLDDAARLVAESQRRLAEGTPVLAATAATAAMEVLGDAGVLTDQPDADWVQLARTEGATLLRAARLAAAAAACQAGDPGAARTAAEAAVGADPLDEAAHRLLMTAHQLAGEPSRALADYARLRVDLATELGADPDPQTRQIHLSILREHPATPDSGTGPPRPARDLPGLVGRAAEITLLTDAWSAACARRASVLLLAGEGGIGKTRLAAEMAAMADATGGLALQSRCYASERSLFLQPFVDALSATLTATPAARLRELAGPHAPGLVGLFPVLRIGARTSGGRTGQRRVRTPARLRGGHPRPDRAGRRPARAVGAGRSAQRRSGHDRAAALPRPTPGRHAAARPRHHPGRGGRGGAGGAGRCRPFGPMWPLPAAAVAHMVAAAGLPEHAETIARRTRGHTLFVVETLRALAAGEAGAPASLQQVVLARLRRTGPATEELLRAGAVLGATVDPATVADMVGLTPQVAAQRCAVAAAARLLVVAGRNYEFANDLIQEVLYATTPEPTRVAYHRRAAELLSHRPELVATHAVATQDWPLAARALLLAAEEATRRFAIADARDLAERALDAAERGGAAALIAEAYLARGHSWVVRSEFRLAFNDHHAALVAARQAGDTRLEMLALRELGGHAGIAVSMADAAGHLAEGLQIAEALGDRGMQARFLDWLAVGSSNRLRFVDALAHGRRAVAIGRASGEDAALAAGLDGLKNAYAYLGWTGELAGVLSELVPLLRRLGDAALLQWAVFESAFAAFGAAEWGTARRSDRRRDHDQRTQRPRPARRMVHRLPELAGAATLAGIHGPSTTVEGQ